MFSGIRRWGRFIKFEHTVFAMPFGLAAMFLAADGWPAGRIFAGVLICLVGARTAAMAFNRLADWSIDQKNPRTAVRSTLVSKTTAYGTMAGGVLALVGGAWILNPLCLILSPIAVGIVFFYSLTKRFTWGSHGFLGLALGTAPVGAWLAVRGQFDSWVPIVLGAAVGLWVAGFDLIYALQDREFDREHGLKSFPAKFGEAAALRMAAGLHVLAVVGLGGAGWMAGLGWRYGLCWCGVCVVLWMERHWSKVEGKRWKAFFQANAVVSLLVLAGVLWEIFSR
ncbi:MAG: 4-hydroxybenzoate octaprenyltransferase [Verrucomicrobia bacterium]|nr:4-hydroxybenzoate octaprenyltransferase [Verrucomicrobiota bacterium]